jgi:predicted negative regulator of RcsB-dependent stress response
MLNAYYYRAECQSDSMNIAINDYLKVLEFPNNNFTLPALVKVARFEFSQHQYGSSALHYSQLIEVVEDQELLNEAIVCLFTSFKMLEDQESQLLYANKILALEKVEPVILAEASLFVANDFYDNSEFYKASKAYKEVVQLQNPDYGAEAQYQLAYLSFLESDFDSSERKVFELSENYFNDYYIALGFILLADIYVEKQNLFQAIATLQSVIDNYSGDDLKEIAINKMNVLQKEQDANSSVILREDIINLMNEIDDDIYIQEDEKLIDDEE